MLQVVFVGLVLVAYFAVYAPTVRKLSTAIRNARVSILQYPERVIANTPAVCDVIAEITGPVVLSTWMAQMKQHAT